MLTKPPRQLSGNEQLVLDHFGLEASDLPELERSVDIDALARQIEDPTKLAVCNILNGRGEIIMKDGKPAIHHEEVPVKNALKILAEKSLRWLKWWD